MAEKVYLDQTKLLQHIDQYMLMKEKNYGNLTITLDEAVMLVTDILAADVVEVRYGEWIEVENTRRGQKFVCSNCKGIVYFHQPTRSKTWKKHCGYAHCPHCLAKMDGKDGAE